jgi:hypothetical protein
VFLPHAPWYPSCCRPILVDTLVVSSTPAHHGPLSILTCYLFLRLSLDELWHCSASSGVLRSTPASSQCRRGRCTQCYLSPRLSSGVLVLHVLVILLHVVGWIRTRRLVHWSTHSRDIVSRSHLFSNHYCNHRSMLLVVVLLVLVGGACSSLHLLLHRSN